jgi:putative tryptophan/tyrosine transport system substrate-binding protein
MRRRELLTIIGGMAITWPLAGRAQEAGRIYRVGVLNPIPRGSPPDMAVLGGLRQHGFIEGQNLAIDYRNYAIRPDLVSEYAAELMKAQPDVVVAAGEPAIRAAQQATKTIPILGFADDLVGAGLVSSMARPDGNTTGLSLLASELDGKRQEILIEAVPGLRRIAALADSNRAAVAKLDALQEAARARNIELSVFRIVRGEEIGAAVDAAKASGAAGLNVLASPMLHANRQFIIDRVAALRLPAIYQWPETAEEGGLIGYGPRLIEIDREIYARQLVQLLRGVEVADIPVEQPTKFELQVNLKTADLLGFTVSQALLTRADKLIE